MDLDIKTATTLEDLRVRLRRGLAPKYGEREAAAMARSIVMHLKGWNRLNDLLANEDREASDFVKGRADDIFQQLMKDMPLQYALGETSFYGLKLTVGPGVLIPRPETAELIDIILRENTGKDLDVLDLCTGSGAIAIALARNLPFSHVEAIDISPAAIAIAKENNRQLKTDIEIRQGDVFSLSLPADSYDIVVSNPPYVTESEKESMEPNVLNYEPHEALFVSDADPLVFYRRIADIANDALRKGGRLYFEINPLFSFRLKQMLESKGFKDVRIIRDIHGKDRFAAATS